MKEIKRNEIGEVVEPDGMIYVESHSSVNRKGPVPKHMLVCGYYRKKKNKKRSKQSFFSKILSVFKR